MNLPISWITENLNISTTDKEYSHKMTMIGQKVERYYKESDDINGIVSAKILEINAHPNADNLLVCSADTGEALLSIVTAATNIYVGAIVPLAKDGATIASGEKISSSEIRGVKSDGMFCSLAELNLTIHDFPDNIENGIMILPPDTPKGLDISSVLNLDDTIFEFEITPNRPDCMSVIGLSRETAAAYSVPFVCKTPKVSSGVDSINDYLKVEKHTENCYRYCAAAVKNVTVRPSPQWMRERLRKSGLRPINNIVDITNYVMLEYGQPMHAFDLRHVAEQTIIIRQAEETETIVTLDGVKHELDSSIMVIADAKSPSAVAGIMGGEYSGIYEDTKTVIFESASFYNLSVRFSAKKLGMRTESSALFEKGLDPHMTVIALNRALELIELLDAGEVVKGIIDVHDELPCERIIPLNPDKINDLLGTNFEKEYMIKTLKQLGFSVDENLIVKVPSFRGDIDGTADLAEEVARLYGYDNIPSTVMSGIALGHLTDYQRFERNIKTICTSAGFYETTTLSFMSSKSLDSICAPLSSYLRNAVRISNPFGEETSLMRTTLLPSLLEVLARNFNVRAKSASVFELSAIYIPEKTEDLPDERKSLTVMCYGDADYFFLKGLLEKVLASCGINNCVYEPMADNPSYHPGRSAAVTVNDKQIALVGEIHPNVANNYGIRARCYAVELDVSLVFTLRNSLVQYKELPRYPSINRDLALVSDMSITSSTIENMLKEIGGELLESITVFDVYTGEGIPKGKKSIAYSLTLRDSEKTLTDSDADSLVNKMLTKLSLHNIVIRS